MKSFFSVLLPSLVVVAATPLRSDDLEDSMRKFVASVLFIAALAAIEVVLLFI